MQNQLAPKNYFYVIIEFLRSIEDREAIYVGVSRASSQNQFFVCFAFIAVFSIAIPNHIICICSGYRTKLQRNVTVNNKERMKTKTAVLSVGKFKFWSFVFVWPCLISKLTLNSFCLESF